VLVGRLHQAELLHAVAQGVAGDPKEFRGLNLVLVEEMDEVLQHALAIEDPGGFLHEGDHLLDEIYETPSAATADIPHSPAGVN